MSHTTIKTANQFAVKKTKKIRRYFYASIGLIILLCLLISLGFWQLKRAEEKRQIENTLKARVDAKPLDIADIEIKGVANSEFYPLKITGEFDNGHQFLLDNQFFQHRVGYQVITPFIISNTSRSKQPKVILINRGWIPRTANRDVLPDIKLIVGHQTVVGIIRIPSTKTLVLGNYNEAGSNWPKLLQALKIDQISQMLNEPIYPFTVMLKAHQPFIYEYNWQPINMSPEKHMGYAVQWFALAATLLVIFIVLILKRKL